MSVRSKPKEVDSPEQGIQVSTHHERLRDEDDREDLLMAGEDIVHSLHGTRSLVYECLPSRVHPLPRPSHPSAPPSCETEAHLLAQSDGLARNSRDEVEGVVDKSNRNRAPLLVNSNWWLVFNDDPLHPSEEHNTSGFTDWQIQRAAWLARRTLEFMPPHCSSRLMVGFACSITRTVPLASATLSVETELGEPSPSISHEIANYKSPLNWNCGLEVLAVVSKETPANAIVLGVGHVNVNLCVRAIYQRKEIELLPSVPLCISELVRSCFLAVLRTKQPKSLSFSFTTNDAGYNSYFFVSDLHRSSTVANMPPTPRRNNFEKSR
ncbi:hypothetical protein BT96DRAFT_941520 [Gymnopus androsaceus JB14]|uniref:Choline/carnitine acyltransferase domain-containing protein n=1 Tax=Gymnopus androsaceus JB14 TaxID=1447944 RepID=A0A6A4HE27_9AGAR|nr:hypothetical protein BT96DRAFT_941520 [Gymnopus androsaceus JB14]